MSRMEFSLDFMKTSKCILSIERVKEIKKIVASITCYNKLTPECLEYKYVMSSHPRIPIRRTFSVLSSTSENYLKAQHQMQESYASQHIWKWKIYKEQNIASVLMSSEQAQNGCPNYAFKWEVLEYLKVMNLVLPSLYKS